MTDKTEDLLKQVTTELDRVGTDVKEISDKSKGNAELSAKTKETVDQLLVKQTELVTIKDLLEKKQTELDGRMSDIEQKLVRRGNAGAEEEKTVGYTVIDDEKVKAFMSSGGKGRVQVNLKSVVNSTSTSAGVLIPQDRQPGIIAPFLRRLTVRDLITPGRTASNTIEYVKENVFTNSAAVISDGTTKPESTITFTEATSPVRTIAHWLKATKIILDDAPMLQSYIDGRLRYGLAYVEEAELLKGSGAGQHLNGIITQATAYSADFVPDMPTRVDTLQPRDAPVRSCRTSPDWHGCSSRTIGRTWSCRRIRPGNMSGQIRALWPAQICGACPSWLLRR
jgi:HK97 family phage major capsid protein